MAGIKAVIFDSGGVMQKGSCRHFFEAVRESTGLRPEGCKATPVSFDKDVNEGKITTRQLLERMYPEAGEKQLQEIIGLWAAEWPPNQEMVKLAKKLKREYVVSLLSNSDDVHEKVAERSGFLPVFEKPVLSHRVGLAKPSPSIFRLALKQLGLKAEECVFVDDALENIEAAERLGFKTIHFRNRRQCERELRKFGVKW